MADTTITSGNTLTAKYYSSKVWNEGKKNTFVNKFMGKGDNVIYEYTELQKSAGDAVIIPMAMNLSGSGVANDSTLEGNEEAMTLYNFTVTVAQIRNAVRIAGAETEIRPAFNLREQAKMVLRQWFTDYIDSKFHTVMKTSLTTGEITFPKNTAGTTMTGVGALNSVCLLTCEMISRAKRNAILHSPKVMPVKVDGKEKHILLAHPYAVRDLKSDTTWLNANYYANSSGSTNPIISGAVGEYDGVVIWEDERIVTGGDGSSAATVAYNMLLGQNAACFVKAKEMFWKEKSFDYDNAKGYAVGYIGTIAKSLFNSKDYGVIHMPTSGATG